MAFCVPRDSQPTCLDGLTIMVLDSQPEGCGIERQPWQQHLGGGNMLAAHVLGLRHALKNIRWSKFLESSITAFFIIMSCFWDVKSRLLFWQIASTGISRGRYISMRCNKLRSLFHGVSVTFLRAANWAGLQRCTTSNGLRIGRQMQGIEMYTAQVLLWITFFFF